MRKPAQARQKPDHFGPDLIRHTGIPRSSSEQRRNCWKSPWIALDRSGPDRSLPGAMVKE
jgi:hypothetical protein